MPFNLAQFERAELVAREGRLIFPSLQTFFDKDEEPAFKVRGLTSAELTQAEEEANRGKQLTDIVQKLLEANGAGDKASALLEGVGISSDDIPSALKKRLGHVCAGLVEPVLDMTHVVKLAESFPIEFTQLANKVMELTGKGRVALGKL